MADVILLSELLPIVEDTIVRAGLTTARLYEAQDEATFFEVHGRTARGAAGRYGRRVDGALMDRLPGLQILANFGVGYETVDVAAAAARGIVVTNTPDVLTEEVADTALALLLATVRELPAAERHLRAGLWKAGPFHLTDTLRGKTVGIYGLGRIGKAIARRCQAFGLTVAYHGRSAQPGVSYAFHHTLVGLARAADILVVMAPGTKDTRNTVNAEVLQALGPAGTLISVSRGTLVDEGALLSALETGAIRAAGLDVFADEPNVPEGLLGLPNVVLLPHVGSASRFTRDAMGKLCADNLVSFLAGNGPLTPVPETPYLGALALAKTSANLVS
jgi:lactate dehydrogenase-like 2-hydroxyacid dehydrogenase